MGGTAPLSLPTEPCHASELLFSIHHQFYSCTKATQHTHEKIDIFIYINIYWASYQCLSTSGLVCAADSWLLLLSGLLSMENAACVVVASPQQWVSHSHFRSYSVAGWLAGLHGLSSDWGWLGGGEGDVRKEAMSIVPPRSITPEINLINQSGDEDLKTIVT